MTEPQVTISGPARLRRLILAAPHISERLLDLVAAWESDRNMLNVETARADAAELRANVLGQRDETETMNIGAALFAMALRDDTGAGEMPAGPCADVLAEWRRLRASLGDSERLVTELVSDVAHARNRADRAEAALAQARALLTEWTNTPFFENKDDWERWVSDYGRRVSKFIALSAPDGAR